MSPTYYLTRERLSPWGASQMARWRQLFFILLLRNAPTMQDVLSLPRNQMLAIGLTIDI